MLSYRAPRRPKIVIFDSGLGGLTVFVELMQLRKRANYLYCADDEAFPYGALAEADLVARVLDVMGRLVEAETPDLVVIACNTASTLALPALRARWPDLPFVGTVPAIKPAAQLSQSKLISVLATPGTVARDYTQRLIHDFAADCAVTLVGSKRLAGFAELEMHGGEVGDADLWEELAPCFIASAQGRTDAIALACTHYPLLLERFRRLSPWEVQWVDPAPAIARRADHILIREFGPEPIHSCIGERRAHFTSGKTPEKALAALLAGYGFAEALSD
jgi:glutamate racemase